MYESMNNCKRIRSLSRSNFALKVPVMALMATVYLGGCAVVDDGVQNIQPPPLPTGFRNDPITKQPIFETPQAATPEADPQLEQIDVGAKPAEPKPEEPKPDQLASPSSSWWQSFHNDELNLLIANAMESNQDVRVAIARIAQAEETAKIANAALYPTASATFNWSGELQSNNSTSGLSASTFYRIPSGGFQASYEADLWGKNGYAAASALALAQASVYYREGVALTLASDITKAYVDFLAESDHIAVGENNLSNARDSLRAVKTRMQQGDATQVEALQQETTVANAEAALEVHHLSQEKAFNKIAALLGKTPSEITLKGGTLSSLVPPELNPGIPAQLMCRRPDIRRAEATMLSANLDINVARASMYPDITFSATYGRSAYNFDSLILPSTLYETIVGSMTQPLFDAGKNAATVRSDRAKYIEMVQTYHQTIVNAVHDVEDALVELRLTGLQRKALVRASGFAKQAYDLSAFSFDKRAIDFLSLLESQRTLYTTQDAEVSSRSDLFKATIDLFTALGGGLEEPHC